MLWLRLRIRMRASVPDHGAFAPDLRADSALFGDGYDRFQPCLDRWENDADDRQADKVRSFPTARPCTPRQANTRPTFVS